MTDLTLPDFDIPDLPEKAVDPRVIAEWIAENVRHLKESGQISAIRPQAWRQPSPVRFRLHQTIS